jgi:hypothetical protein
LEAIFFKLLFNRITLQWRMRNLFFSLLGMTLRTFFLYFFWNAEHWLLIHRSVTEFTIDIFSPLKKKPWNHLLLLVLIFGGFLCKFAGNVFKKEKNREKKNVISMMRRCWGIFIFCRCVTTRLANQVRWGINGTGIYL